jgi:beta-carotene 3-hydroxylase
MDSYGPGIMITMIQNQKRIIFFEKNDRFFLVFAIPSFLCFLTGLLTEYTSFTFIGTGILIYGFCYFLVHDVFIHQRF